MESTIADHAACAVVDVQHRREGQIDAMGAQLGRQHVTHVVRELTRVRWLARPTHFPALASAESR